MPNYADGHVVTSAEFNAVCPVGAILPFAGSAAPTNWIICDGSAVSRTTFADLFAVCGITYGSGDGSTTFNVPDLRTRIPVGFKTGDANFGTRGGVGGAATHAITVAELPSHQHLVSGNTNSETTDHTHPGPSHTHTLGAAVVNTPGSGAIVEDRFSVIGSGSTPNVTDAAFLSGSTDAGGTGNTGGRSASHVHAISFQSGLTGSGNAVSLLQPYMSLVYIIHA